MRQNKYKITSLRGKNKHQNCNIAIKVYVEINEEWSALEWNKRNAVLTARSLPSFFLRHLQKEKPKEFYVSKKKQ